MKALAIFLMSAVPAAASISQDAADTDMQCVPQAVAMKANPSTDATCGEAREMISVVRDQDGSVVAIGKAHVAPVC